MLKIKNTMSNKKEVFKPLKKGVVSMYVCGPTVYGPGHIGHARTYIAFDIIRRYLEFSGYKVKYIVNITDVHDDMIEQAKKEKTDIFKLGEKYMKLFFEDMKKLSVKKATFYPRVTREIKEIIFLIKKLEEKGFAYETNDGVYYNIRKFKGYGKLSKIKIKKSVTGTRVQTDKYDKSNPQDFALWKKAKPDEPSWPSPWGRGRPGWHIECSAMNLKYLGKQIDIHCGAVDLIFPHHENEIAQTEPVTNKKPFVKYWLHTGFLNVENQKMSKSLGNFITIPELLNEYDAKTFRFFISTIHYRSRVDFSKKSMAKAKNSLEKLNEFVFRLYTYSPGKKQKDFSIKNLVKKFYMHMDNDFGFPNAWAEIFRLVKKANLLMDKNVLSKKSVKEITLFLKTVNSFFMVLSFPKKVMLSKKQRNLVKQREKLRKNKEFEKADEIRKQLLRQGIELIDVGEKTIVKKR